MTDIICGVDVGAATLDARIGRHGPWRQVANTPDGHAELATFCREHGVGLVVMEATGGYERAVFGALWAEGLPAAIVNPRAVRRFADGMGVLEKTDRIDCGMIAWYAQTKAVRPTPLAAPTQARLTALVVRLRQLTALKVAQANQARLVTEPAVLASFTAVLAAAAGQIRALEAHIAQAIADDPVWAALDRTFRTIKGVADRTVAHLMAEMPEIGTLSNKAVAKLAGLAPIANDSGRRAGKRPVRGGRAGVRGVLFVVAEIVRRYEPDFADLHHRLSQAGKPKSSSASRSPASCSCASTQRPAISDATSQSPLDPTDSRSPERERVGVRDATSPENPGPSPCPSPARDRGPALSAPTG